MKVKHYILIILCIIVNTSTFAQKSKVKNLPTYEDIPIHFGFSFGINKMDFIFTRNLLLSETGSLIVPEINKTQFGFQINVVSDFRLGEYVRLRILPGCSFGDRDIIFWRPLSGVDKKIYGDTISIESSFAEMPILIKYKAKRINNYAPYLIAGINPRWDFEAKNKSIVNLNQAVSLTHLDFYFEMGIGIDFYNQYFKFAPELKLSLGMLDIINHNSSYTSSGNTTNYTKSIEKLNSKMVMLTFYFE